jgi:hypothetical protein
MVNHKSDKVLAEKIARVLVSVDLTDVSTEDIDAFLDAVDVEPFSDEKVQRILGKASLGRLRGAARERRGGRNGNAAGPTASAGRRRFRLDCEQLERRMAPSLFASPWGARDLDGFSCPPSDWTVQSVRLRVDTAVGEMTGPGRRGPDSPWGDGSPFEDGELQRSVSAEMLNSVFASRDYQADAGAAGEDFQTVLAWNLLSSQSAAPDAEFAELQLAG